MQINQHNSQEAELFPKKLYLGTLVECVIAFFISTFCIAMFFSHLGNHWFIPAIILLVLYVFVIAVCIIMLVKRLSMAAIMLITPIVPLVALLLILMLIPLLQHLK